MKSVSDDIIGGFLHRSTVVRACGRISLSDRKKESRRVGKISCQTSKRHWT